MHLYIVMYACIYVYMYICTQHSFGLKGPLSHRLARRAPESVNTHTRECQKHPTVGPYLGSYGGPRRRGGFSAVIYPYSSPSGGVWPGYAGVPMLRYVSGNARGRVIHEHATAVYQHRHGRTLIILLPIILS